jgi:hypothetical protein
MTLLATAEPTLPSSTPGAPPAHGQGNHATGQPPAPHHETKWSWSCRAVDLGPNRRLEPENGSVPRVGDVALVRVGDVGHHTRVATADGQKLRLYPGDVLSGVFGNRYATDAFEGEVRATDPLHLLTDAGMIGTVCSRHVETRRPTTLRFLGFLADETGRRVNLKELRFHPTTVPAPLGNVLLVVGTAMNSGKTTTAAKLVKALLHRGVRIAACKLTGSVCQRDRGEFHAAGAHHCRDFSDYGFPSTYLATEDELLGLFETMTADAARASPDLTVLEIADGVLQRETRLLLAHPALRQVRGVVVTAPCSASALFGIAQVAGHGLEVVAVSGRITNSPLCVREFEAASRIPVASSVGEGNELAELVLRCLGLAP